MNKEFIFDVDFFHHLSPKQESNGFAFGSYRFYRGIDKKELLELIH